MANEDKVNTFAHRRLRPLEGNSQRLDGGAMFGNAPKALWKNWIEPDENNRIPLACRSLLVEEETAGTTRRVLFETGIGAFFEPRLKIRYGVVESEHVLLKSLGALNLTHEEIDLVVLSHLHFDHAGGLLSAWQEDRPSQLLFPNARYLVSRAAWERALIPHERDRASFIPDITRLLQASGRLHLVDTEKDALLGDGYRFHYSEGHTPGMLLTEVATDSVPVLFCGDLIPGRFWVHHPITMGYDRYPEKLVDEKRAMLSAVMKRKARLFFTHDHKCAFAEVARGVDGRFYVVNELAQPEQEPVADMFF